MSLAPWPGPARSVHSRMKAPKPGWAARAANVARPYAGPTDWDANSVAVSGPLVGSRGDRGEPRQALGQYDGLEGRAVATVGGVPAAPEGPAGATATAPPAAQATAAHRASRGRTTR